MHHCLVEHADHFGVTELLGNLLRLVTLSWGTQQKRPLQPQSVKLRPKLFRTASAKYDTLGTTLIDKRFHKCFTSGE
jgi:hypothetical protein